MWRAFFLKPAIPPNGLCLGIGTRPAMSLRDLEADCYFYRFLGGWGNFGECPELLINDIIICGFAGLVSMDGRKALGWEFGTRMPGRPFNCDG